MHINTNINPTNHLCSTKFKKVWHGDLNDTANETQRDMSRTTLTDRLIEIEIL